MSNLFDYFLSLSIEEQENYLLRGARGWGKQNTFLAWLDELFKEHPEFIDMYGRVLDRWEKAVEM